MRLFYKQWYLSTRILFSVLIPVLGVASFLVVYQTNDFEKYTLIELNKQSQIINRSISLAAEYALLSNNQEELLPFIEEVMLRPEIQSIIVLDEDGNIFISKNKSPEENETLLFQLPINQQYLSNNNEESDLYISSENGVKYQHEIGKVKLVISLKPLRERQKNSFLKGIFFAFLGVCGAVSISIILMRSIQIPVRKIGNALNEISTGNLSVRINITDGGELGQLRDRCNWMVEQIEKKNKTLNVAVKQAEALELEAVNANELKSKFMAHISHDIRTPLSNMIMAIEAMEKKVNDGPTTILYYLKHLIGAARQQRLIINDLLDWSKMEDGLYELQYKWFGINNVLMEAFGAFKATALDKNIDLNIDIIDSENICNSDVKGDPINLIKIINNIVSNAIKFTNKGTISVICNFEKNTNNELTLIITIQDSGIGIDEKDLSSIFEPFLQGSQQLNSSEERGSGLGLSIVKEIVGIMGGTIEIESKLKLGTIVTVEIPYKYKIQNQQEKIKILPSIPSGNIANEIDKILVVDDNEMALELVQSSLENSGFTVDIAKNGLSAINKLKNSKYSHILMDLDMPNMDGFQTTNSIRQLDQGRKTKIIALTANTVPGIKEKCLNNGMNDYLEKPFEHKELLTILSKWNKKSAKVINIKG